MKSKKKIQGKTKKQLKETNKTVQDMKMEIEAIRKTQMRTSRNKKFLIMLTESIDARAELSLWELTDSGQITWELV